MNATINSTGETISGRTLAEISGKMKAMLQVSGPRGLTAMTVNGAEIHVEMYDGQDYIITAEGRLRK